MAQQSHRQLRALVIAGCAFQPLECHCPRASGSSTFIA